MAHFQATLHGSNLYCTEHRAVYNLSNFKMPHIEAKYICPNHGSDSVKAILVITNTPISVGSRSARVLSLSQQCLAWHVRSSQGALFSLYLTFLDFTGTPEGKWEGPQLSWPAKLFGGSMAQRRLLCYTPSLCFYFSPPENILQQVVPKTFSACSTNLH